MNSSNMKSTVNNAGDESIKIGKKKGKNRKMNQQTSSSATPLPSSESSKICNKITINGNNNKKIITATAIGNTNSSHLENGTSKNNAEICNGLSSSSASATTVVETQLQGVEAGQILKLATKTATNSKKHCKKLKRKSLNNDEEICTSSKSNSATIVAVKATTTIQCPTDTINSDFNKISFCNNVDGGGPKNNINNAELLLVDSGDADGGRSSSSNNSSNNSSSLSCSNSHNNNNHSTTIMNDSKDDKIITMTINNSSNSSRITNSKICSDSSSTLSSNCQNITNNQNSITVANVNDADDHLVNIPKEIQINNENNAQPELLLLPVVTTPTATNNLLDFKNIQIEYKEYESELQMQDIMRLIQAELSEPYSIYTYRYFIYNWPKLCFLAAHGNEYVGAIVCKLDMHMHAIKRGYIAMLAVKKEYRKLKIGTNLVQKAIEAMLADDADEVVLETEMKNLPALRLYENLGFVRDKRLFRYYLNGVDALRLKLWFR